MGIRRRRFERSRRQRRFRPGALQRRLCHEQVFRPRADAGTFGRTWRQVACSPRLRATSDAVVAGEWLSGECDSPHNFKYIRVRIYIRAGAPIQPPQIVVCFALIARAIFGALSRFGASKPSETETRRRSETCRRSVYRGRSAIGWNSAPSFTLEVKNDHVERP